MEEAIPVSLDQYSGISMSGAVPRMLFAVKGNMVVFTGIDASTGVTSTINAAESVVAVICLRENISWQNTTFYDLQTSLQYKSRGPGNYFLDRLVIEGTPIPLSPIEKGVPIIVPADEASAIHMQQQALESQRRLQRKDIDTQRFNLELQLLTQAIHVKSWIPTLASSKVCYLEAQRVLKYGPRSQEEYDELITILTVFMGAFAHFNLENPMLG